MHEKKQCAAGALRVFKSRKEPLPSGGGIFSAVSEPHPCTGRENCGILWAMNGRLFQGGEDVPGNKQPYGLPRRPVYTTFKGG